MREASQVYTRFGFFFGFSTASLGEHLKTGHI
jgi:hypothetical protein